MQSFQMLGDAELRLLQARQALHGLLRWRGARRGELVVAVRQLAPQAQDGIVGIGNSAAVSSAVRRHDAGWRSLVAHVLSDVERERDEEDRHKRRLAGRGDRCSSLRSRVVVESE